MIKDLKYLFLCAAVSIMMAALGIGGFWTFNSLGNQITQLNKRIATGESEAASARQHLSNELGNRIQSVEQNAAKAREKNVDVAAGWQVEFRKEMQKRIDEINRILEEAKKVFDASKGR